METGGIPVKNRLQLGSTSIVGSAIKAGEIDLYPEYTGNAVFFMGATRHRQPDLQQRRFLRAVKFC
ncbi:glycine betaine ABC transporter substrate-binding protein [uncultured Marinobacter sp.]|uniref:glycine betaine ABC transporter substrate-binding protein n=1 Tax=uncultured Marinobacter sp. TaxID=187379 RepID=UPI0030DBB2B2